METSKPSEESRSALKSAATNTNATEDAQVSGSRPRRVPLSGTDAATDTGTGRERDNISREPLVQAVPGQTLAPSGAFASAVLPLRGRERSNMDAFQNKISREPPAQTVPGQTLAPSDVSASTKKDADDDAPPRKERRGSGVQIFRNKFSSSTTVDPQSSQTGAFQVHGSSDTTQTRPSQPPSPVPVPPAQSPLGESTLAGGGGEFLVEATLVPKHDFLVGEIVEPAREGFWRQRKVQLIAFLLFLSIVVVAVGVSVSVDGGSGSGGVGDGSEPPIFECSNDTNGGCRYIGKLSLNFQDPSTFLVAFCEEADFRIPTSDSCDCEVNILDSASGDPEICQSCSFLDSANGWGIAYDCSNVIEGECVGRDTAGNCISNLRQCFDTTRELRDAVDEYLDDNGPGSRVAGIYGFPIGKWCVSKIQDFSYLFSSDDDDYSAERRNLQHTTTSERFNFAATNFNGDISQWDVSNATTMRSMFSGNRATERRSRFNQWLADWDVSGVTDMRFMFSGAKSFNQPIGNWDVTSVTNMRRMFDRAGSFDQTLADWNVSSVIDMSYMFGGASSFNQSIGNWDVSLVTDMEYMFVDAESFNQPIGNWKVSSVTTMSGMFFLADSFNQPVGSWDVTSVKNMVRMFSGAKSFNQPIGNWDVSNVTDMRRIFLGASSFNQPLGNWDVSNTDTTSIFDGSGCPAFENSPRSCFYT
jgi:surface protein